tara:strand:- start:309 stop:1007 length:699 start_codon:yes stop_codon:yes gene_type:complete
MALPKLETPMHTCVLPSKQETIQYRPFLVGEQKILLVAQESENTDDQVTEMLRVVQSCTDVNVDELSNVDLEYLFLQIRIKSIGETSDVGLQCKECNAENRTVVDLSKTEVVGTEEKISNNIQLSDTISLELRQPSLKHLQEMGTNQTDESVFRLLNQTVLTITDGDEVFTRDDFSDKELDEFIETMSIQMLEKVQKYLTNVPKLILSHNFICESCEKDNNYELEGIANFFD